MEYFVAVLSTLAAVVTIVMWGRGILKERPRHLIYPIVLVILTVLATYQFVQNSQLRAIRKDASTLVSSWPKVEHLKFVSKGERIGIALAGLAFLEKHKDEFPETYNTANELVKNRAKSFNPPKGSDERWEEFGLLEDISVAMISLVSSIAK